MASMKKLIKSIDKYDRLFSKPSKHDPRYFLTFRRLKPELRFETIIVDFTPAQTQEYSLEKEDPCFPIFNKDKNHYTKAFILPKDREYCLSKPKKLRDRFEERLMKKVQEVNSFEERSFQMVCPEAKYCQICQKKYQNYSTHIQERIHQKSTHTSQGQKFIGEIINDFVKKKKSQLETPKKKPIRKIKRKQGMEEWKQSNRHSPKTAIR